MLASKSPTTTVFPLIAIETPNQSLVVRTVGVSSANCAHVTGGVAAHPFITQSNPNPNTTKLHRTLGISPPRHQSSSPLPITINACGIIPRFSADPDYISCHLEHSIHCAKRRAGGVELEVLSGRPSPLPKSRAKPTQ